MAKYVMALDAGTTSNRCILFNEKGEICSMAQKEFTQYYPQPGWVEHDASEIWQTQLSVARIAMQQVGATYQDIAAIGITNQRETVIVWDRKTGQPVYHAIVWQCRRTADMKDELLAKYPDIADSAYHKTAYLVHFLSSCGEHYDTYGRAFLTYLLADRKTVYTRHHYIKENDIEVSVFRLKCL